MGAKANGLARIDGDSAMCQDAGCPSRFECWRFSRQHAQYQEYASFERQRKADKCADFVLWK